MRVFISSTPSELESHQRVAIEVAQALGYETVVRDPTTRQGIDAITACARQVALADAYRQEYHGRVFAWLGDPLRDGRTSRSKTARARSSPGLSPQGTPNAWRSSRSQTSPPSSSIERWKSICADHSI